METAEQTNDSRKFLVYLDITKLFETLFEFVVRVESDIVWSLGTGVHEVLETLISCLLKLDIVAKGFLDQLIHLFFEFQQKFGELDGVF